MQKTFVALALAAGLVGGAARAEETTVKIQDYPGIGNMLYRIAASKGYCEKHGIKCQLQMIASGPLGVQALLAKSVDVAFAPPEVAINASLKAPRSSRRSRARAAQRLYAGRAQRSENSSRGQRFQGDDGRPEGHEDRRSRAWLRR
ncbi:MAG: hypothetical protein H6870_17495 [Methylobacteriaceae bacterium]|nr:hypothetical protein [Methylobacteriaceae bacterium]